MMRKGSEKGRGFKMKRSKISKKCCIPEEPLKKSVFSLLFFLKN
jgi:hypothetical protein